MGCSDRSAAERATFPEGHRDAPAPRSRTPSNLDSSDMPPAAGARARSDTPAPTRRAVSASRCGAGQSACARNARCQLRAQGHEGGVVRPRCRSNDDVTRRCGQQGKDLEADDFAKASLEAIAFHDRVTVFRNDDADPWITPKGSEKPNLEVFGSSSLPFTQNLVEIRPSSQALPSRVGGVLRRRRTCWAAGR